MEFTEVLEAITAMRDECQRQIDNKEKCPFHQVKPKIKPNEYDSEGILQNMEVWDWVIDGRNMQIRQITHDDMMDLPGEHVDRFATEEEINEHLQFLKIKEGKPVQYMGDDQ